MRRGVYWIIVRIIDMGYRILRPIVHCLLALAYWSRSRTVPPVRDPILKMSATELAKQICERKMSSEEVVRAFVERIVEVEPFVNATVERRFGDALREAREADVLLDTMDAPARQRIAREKPLLGVPFTVKVLLTVKGMRSTAGSLLFQDLRAYEDAPSVALLKEAGGIVLCTTNTAEMGMNFETNNFLHGTTANPYDTTRTSGGSSGGESALISAAGSVIGLGNDLAGSIRLPCMFTGLFGHKPSRGMVPNGGCFPVVPIALLEMLSSGPMCRYAQDLQTTMQVLATGSDKRVKFGREVEFRNIKIHYMQSFPEMPLVEKVDLEIQEAVKKVATYFETKHGSTCKRASIPLLSHSNSLYLHALVPPPPISIVDALTCGKGDVDATQELLKLLFRQSNFTIGPIVAMNFPSIPIAYRHSDVGHYKKLADKLYGEFDKLLDDDSVLVLPTMPFPAPYHHEIPLLAASTCYTHVFNVLGLPVTQCPVGLNKSGLPIGVQVVGKMGNDALTVACAVELEKAFGGWIPPK